MAGNYNYKYKGTVPFLEDLATIENPSYGDTYRVEYLKDTDTGIQTEYGVKYYYSTDDKWVILRTTVNGNKNVKFKKKINGFIYDLNVVSDGKDIILDDNGSTVASKIADFEDRLDNIDGEKIATIEAKVNKLENSTDLVQIKAAVTQHTSAIANIESTKADKIDIATINATLETINSKLDEIRTAVTANDEEVGNVEEVFGEDFVDIGSYIDGLITE